MTMMVWIPAPEKSQVRAKDNLTSARVRAKIERIGVARLLFLSVDVETPCDLLGSGLRGIMIGLGAIVETESGSYCQQELRF